MWKVEKWKGKNDMNTQTVWNMNGFPKVGIRPIIDGRRRGVRESLEVQTMKMPRRRRS